MRALDNEKDLLIKKMLEKDQLISKKADDVFQDFFERGIKMEEEKVVKMDEHKNKNIRKKKILAAVASLMVVFVAANVYAGTMGYNNIFFMIKNMFEKTEVTNKDDILTDRDLTISYQSIETSDGLKIQVNRLVVKNNEAVLYMNIDKTNTSVNPARCIVHDITDGRNDLIGNEAISNPKNEARFEAQISLIGMKNNTNLLNIQLQDDNYNNIVELELDIANKTISIVGGTAKELEKISEVELKEVLGNYIRIFMYEDLDLVLKEIHTEQQYINEGIVDIALNYLTQEKNVYSAERSRVNSIIKELTGEDITEVLPVSNVYVTYDKKTDSYNYFVKTKGRKALCLEVTDLKYSDGIYTATFIYCYPTEEDYKKGNVENLQLFSATMKLKINSDYEYAKYCMVDYKNIERKKIDNNSQSIVNTNENTVTNTVNNNTVTNTLNNNTVTNTVNNTTVNNTVTNTVANNHTHKYTVVESSGNTTIDGTHTVRCSICGAEKQEPHNFGKWWTINNGTAWTLWCKDCKTYVYTTDYNFVKKHSEYGMEPGVNSETNTVSNDQVNDYSNVNNYASTMKWTEYWAPGIKFQYPTEFNLEEEGGYYRGNRPGEISTRINGRAVGINPDTKEIIDSSLVIYVYEPISSNEDVNKYKYNTNGMEKPSITANGLKWYCESKEGKEFPYVDSYVNIDYFDDGSYTIQKIEFCTDNRDNFKITNIENWLFGTVKLTSY